MTKEIGSPTSLLAYFSMTSKVQPRKKNTAFKEKSLFQNQYLFRRNLGQELNLSSYLSRYSFLQPCVRKVLSFRSLVYVDLMLIVLIVSLINGLIDCWVGYMMNSLHGLGGESACFIHSSIHPYIHSFIHSVIHSFIHSFIHTFIHSFIQPFMYIFIHLFIHSSISYLR